MEVLLLLLLFLVLIYIFFFKITKFESDLVIIYVLEYTNNPFDDYYTNYITLLTIYK